MTEAALVATGVAVRVRSASAGAAVAVVMLAAGTAVAQTVPYQSSMREQVGTGPGQEPLPRGGEFRPRIETAIQYVNNINLAERSQDEINTYGVELTPGFYASYSSGTAIGAIDYSIIGRAWDDSDYNDVSQRGAANGSWTVVPNLLSLQGQASITDNVIDPALSLNYGGLGIFGQENLSQQAIASISPVLRKRFSDLEFLAQYSYGRVWYFDQGNEADQVGFIGQDDSKDQSFFTSLGTAEDVARKLTGSLFYSWEHTSYDNALPYEFERLGVDAGWRIYEKLTLVGDVGVESDLDKSTTQGGLDSNFWSAGFRWEPDDRTDAEARYGHRFFGSTYFLSVSRRTRFLEFTASYDESPQVETSILSLGEFTPGELPPGTDPGTDFGRLNSSPFVGKNARVGITAVGSLTSMTIGGFWTQQDYIRNAQDDDTYLGGTFQVTRELASNLSMDFSASYTDYEQSQLTTAVPPTRSVTNDYDTQFVLRLNRDSGSKLTTSLEAGYLNRSGSEQYNGWWTGLRARWTP